MPDIVVMGKPIGNGHPLAAVVTTPEIAASFDNGMEFFSTFGGNPVSCADRPRRARRRAGRAAAAARAARGRSAAPGSGPGSRHSLVGDVRGSGLFLGVDLVRDRGTLEPATEEAARGRPAARARHPVGTDGPFHNVLKIRPPLVFTRADADTVVAALDEVLAEDPVAARPARP